MPETSPSPRNAYAVALVAIALTLTIVSFPEDAFEASLYGLKLWFDIVLPALLPFFAMAEILMGLGVIHLAGVLLEPLMRSLFRIPGVGGFAVAIGLASGYPLGAKISGRIRRDGLCTGVEGERLISFANTADPLFMVGAVAVGMFAAPELGAPIAAAHYLAVVMVGFLMRFHGARTEATAEPHGGGPLLRRALDALYQARARDRRPLGQLFADAVRESVTSLLFIGGCIMMFSVFIRILQVSGAVPVLAGALGAALAPLGVHADIVRSLVSGIVEITIGTEAASKAMAPDVQKVVAASAIIGWSGLSVHAQVAAMVYGTDIRIAPYIFARMLHGVLAAAWTLVLLGPARPVLDAAVVPVLARAPFFEPLSFGARIWASTLTAGWVVAILLALAAATHLSRRVAVLWLRVR